MGPTIPGLAFLPPSLQRSLTSLDADSLAKELLQAWELKNERERYAFFTPNGAQESFIKLLGYYQPFVAIFSAANGVGKTALASNIVANLIFGPQSKPFSDYDLFRAWKFPKRARFITDSKLVEEIGPWHSEAQHWWPKGRYIAYKSGKPWYATYRGNGWLLDVMTYDQATKDFEGATLGLAIFDEPPPAPIWHATVSRMRKGGLILVLMTPLTSAAWFFDQVVPKYQSSIIYADVEDNCKEHGRGGQLKHEDIQRMIGAMSPDEVEARAHGKALALAYLIYKTFDRRIHVASEVIQPPPGAQVWQIVDPHIDKPFACIWGYPGHDGTFTQFDEWPNDDFYTSHQCHFGLPEYRDIFRKKEEKLNVTRRIIDRHFAQVRSYVSKRTLFEEMEVLGLDYEPSYKAGPNEKEVETGVMKVRSYLAYDATKAVDGANRPKYIVSPTCHNTIKGFERWSFDAKTMDYSDNYKDFMDVVRYAVMADPTIVNVPMRREARNIFG
jgi:hypothetical protein